MEDFRRFLQTLYEKQNFNISKMSDFKESLFGCHRESKSCCLAIACFPCGAACVQGGAVAASNVRKPEFCAPCMLSFYL